MQMTTLDIYVYYILIPINSMKKNNNNKRYL